MNPWTLLAVAQAQRALADQQLQQDSLPIQFRALADAVRFTHCPGDVWEVGCASGYNREALDRQGVAYRDYGGSDISPAAIEIANERYPEGVWVAASVPSAHADVVIDGCALMHADDWKAHLAGLCARSRRWVILHRVPLAYDTKRTATNGYGQTFDAWQFSVRDLNPEMFSYGFDCGGQRMFDADSDSWTIVYAKAREYASYCDRVYLSRMKALIASMQRHCRPFVLHVLAFDEETAQALKDVHGVRVTVTQDFLALHPDMAIDKLPGPPRTKVEHMWTVGPAYLAWLVRELKTPITYVDADIMFHSSPEPVFAEIGGAPAAVFPHNFASASQGLPGPTVESHEVFGKYNVGLVYIADRAIAEEWAAQCREWCYDRVEQVPIPERRLRYGDQKYLDDWPSKGAHVVAHPGANLGPWAIHTRSLYVRDGHACFGGRRLVAFHYSGYRELPEGHTVMTRPEYQLTERQAQIIYVPYIQELEKQR